MKKITVILAALAAAFAVSCTKETPETQLPQDQNAPAGMKQVTITASIDGADTKTSYDAAGKFSWTKGDKISVLCSDAAVYTFTATSKGASTTFTGMIPEGVTLGSQAFFPADDNHAENSLHLAASSDAIDASLPMIGSKTNENVYAFEHCSGGFQFTVENIPSGITVLEAQFVTTTLKISGTYGVWHNDDGKFIYGVYSAANDAEKAYSRKFSVSAGIAKVYLPYGVGGDLWGTTTMKLIGYDDMGQATELVTKDLKLGGKVHARAVVIPVAPLKLPKVSNLKNIDWTDVNVATYVQEDWMYSSYPQYSDIKELKAVADADFVYVCATPTKAVNEIRFFFADHGTNKSGDLWMWEQTQYGTYYKSARATVTDNKFNLLYNGTDVELITEFDGENVIWKMAFPREAGSWTSLSGSVYLGIMTYGEGFEAPIPKVFGNMLEVTLP